MHKGLDATLFTTAELCFESVDGTVVGRSVEITNKSAPFLFWCIEPFCPVSDQ